MIVAKGCCLECGCSLDARWHDSVHEMWEVGRENVRRYERERQPEMMEVEIVHNGKRYKGAIPCIGEE